MFFFFVYILTSQKLQLFSVHGGSRKNVVADVVAEARVHRFCAERLLYFHGHLSLRLNADRRARESRVVACPHRFSNRVLLHLVSIIRLRQGQAPVLRTDGTESHVEEEEVVRRLVHVVARVDEDVA